jgi:hypothetical protein
LGGKKEHNKINKISFSYENKIFHSKFKTIKEIIPHEIQSLNIPLMFEKSFCPFSAQQ